MSITTILGSTKVRRRDARTGLVVELSSAGLSIRESGRRITYGPISYGRIFQLGAQMYADAVLREKARLKKERQVARKAAKRR
jgi:hypothetical protein